MLHYILVLLGVVAVAVFWVLFQIWLQRQQPDGATTSSEDVLHCKDCNQPCGKQVIGSQKKAVA